ncbi:glycosyltransferase [Bosea sp. (in: a-proteobacteria)]|uniref:glycosyltransferase n=1 Tax=Bosea sp. (in: a-proteobacteria) TaxID=1871050 RepID=UPI003F6FD2BC
MPQLSLAALRQALYRNLGIVLGLAAPLAGRFSPRMRWSISYLANLIAQKRYAEVDALVVHLRDKLLRRLRSPLGTGRRSFGQVIPIDAATERFDAAGNVVSKQCWRYPSESAPLLVSVVVPRVDSDDRLEATIASVRSQTITPCEIIVVEDGSHDPANREHITPTDDPMLRLVRRMDRTPASARDSGIAAARGEFVCCLDPTDLLDPTYLECAIAVHLADPATGFVYAQVKMVGNEPSTWEAVDFDVHQALHGACSPVSAVFRRDDWSEIGGFASSADEGDDREFWIRLSALGRRGRSITHPLILRRSTDTATRPRSEDQQEAVLPARRSLNRPLAADSSLMRRIAQVVGREQQNLRTLERLTQSFANPHKPGLLVVVPWLRRGGAEVLLLSVLQACARDWNLVIVTTERDAHPMTDAFRSVTDSIVHLSGTIAADHRLEFLRHLAMSRGVTHGLTSNCAWFLSRLRTFKASLPGEFRIANILHNEVPDSVFRAAVEAGSGLDRHVAVSRRAAEALLVAGVDPQRMQEIGNGIDPQPWSDSATEREKTRQGLGLVASDLMLLWVGRFAPEKRPEVFVDLLAALRDNPCFQGAMIGEGPLEKAVDASIFNKGLGALISRAGHLEPDEVRPLIAAADMLVVTSAFEGMPLVVLEALAAGCPVAATDVGDIARVVQHDRNGVLVDSAEPMALATLIPPFLAQRLDEHHRADIRAAFAEGPHTLKTMQAQYLEMLKAL